MSLLSSKFIQFILSLCVVIITIAIIGGIVNDDTQAAEGDLLITWINTNGDQVASGDPIFLIDDLKPGDTYTASVSVTNEAQSERNIALRGNQTDILGELADVLLITISHDNAGIYEDTSLTDFFIESNPLGIPLFTLQASQTESFTITIHAPKDIGNTYQLNSFQFDLTIGITTDDGEVPQACADIDFNGESITGTQGNDRLDGTPGNDLIFGLEGNDRIRGHGGDDCIVGGDGNDRLDGGIGKDIILGGAGNDEIDGGNGEDYIEGNEGHDEIDGGNENDIIYGDSGNDEIDGGNSNDEIYGGEGDDTIKGGNGNDVIGGGTGDDDLEGSNGDDILTGDDGHDKVDGRLGYDTCQAEEVRRCEA